jgi:hypothetical protein
MFVPQTPSPHNLLGLAGQTIAQRDAHLASPSGHTYVTTAGSALLFPALAVPTGELPEPPARYPPFADRAAMMPRRKRTRAQDREYRIAAERQLNDARLPERNAPPPF